MSEKEKQEEYSAKDIRVTKEDIEKVRKWPAMYIGSTDERG
jgi:DNA gyrase/topoisomerase IV subunit B